jgi:Bacterial Ig domain
MTARASAMLRVVDGMGLFPSPTSAKHRNPVYFRPMRRLLILSSCLLGLVACPKPDDATKPTVAIQQPAGDATITGAVTVQVDAQDSGSGISKVSVYAMGQGAKGGGVLIGTAISKPYVIAWRPNEALGVPNAANLELIAVARDFAGNEETSAPVRVKTQNPGAASLNLVTAFTYPPNVTLSSRGSNGKPPAINAQGIQAPTGVSLETRAVPALRPLDVANRVFALEWEWFPVAGVDGYCVYTSPTDLAGEYKQERCQTASTGAAKEKFSKIVEGGATGAKFWGAVTTVSSNRTVESGKSNADGATFLPPQDSATPAEGASVTDGKPNLTWTPTTGASGYLFYVYDRNPWESGAVLKGTNFPKSTAATASTWSDGSNIALPVLSSGTYYWWVAGVSFDAQGRADGISFSDPKRFTVP